VFDNWERAFKETDEVIKLLPSEVSGCTFTIFHITKDIVECANAGDSTAGLGSFTLNSNEFKTMTTDHKPEDEEERKRVEDSGGSVQMGRVMPLGLAVSRALGDFEIKKYGVIYNPSINRVALEKPSQHNFAFIGSDGVWDELEKEDILKNFTSAQNDVKVFKDAHTMTMHSARAAYMETCADCGHYCDDCTLIVIDLNNYFLSE
jgi:serine/threonine protein phosphatase PrpC